MVSDRVGLGGAKSAPFTWGQPHASRFCAPASSVFEAFLAKRALRRVLRVRQRTPKRFNPHLYQTGSDNVHNRQLFLFYNSSFRFMCIKNDRFRCTPVLLIEFLETRGHHRGQGLLRSLRFFLLLCYIFIGQFQGEVLAQSP